MLPLPRRCSQKVRRVRNTLHSSQAITVASYISILQNMNFYCLFPNRASCGLDLIARNNRRHVAPGNDFSTIRRLRFKSQIASSLSDQVTSQSIKRGIQFSVLNVLCQC